MKTITLALLLASQVAFAQVPGVVAKSYIVTDLDGNVLVKKDADVPRPIASITKLLVAEQVYPIIAPSNRIHARTEQELLEMALISSSNKAIIDLAKAHDEPTIIMRVNETAKARGLTTISIEEPSGLSKNNVASAKDLAKFMALVKDSEVAKVSVSPAPFKPTNPLIGKPGWSFHASKTGFINAAGGCVATIVEIGGRPLIVVILGSTNVMSRWMDLIRIRTFIAESDQFWSLNTISIPRGRRNEHHGNSKRSQKNLRSSGI
jgi:D-alanyl-D-alanine carboxypeptidase